MAFRSETEKMAAIQAVISGLNNGSIIGNSYFAGDRACCGLGHIAVALAKERGHARTGETDRGILMRAVPTMALNAGGASATMGSRESWGTHLAAYIGLTEKERSQIENMSLSNYGGRRSDLLTYVKGINVEVLN